MSQPRIAFTAVIHNNQYVIGAAEEGFPGWTPTTYDAQPSYEQAQEFADLLNQEKLGLTKLDATEIVLSSMFPRRVTSQGGK